MDFEVGELVQVVDCANFMDAIDGVSSPIELGGIYKIAKVMPSNSMLTICLYITNPFARGNHWWVAERCLVKLNSAEGSPEKNNVLARINYLDKKYDWKKKLNSSKEVCE